METITERQLYSLIGSLDATSLATVVLRSETGAEYEISGNVVIDVTECKFYSKGYTVAILDRKNKKCRSYEMLIKFLKKEKVLTEDSVTLVSINDRFSSLREYEEELVFDALNMRGLIEKYENIADSFVLVGGANETCPISPSEAEKILSVTEQEFLERNKKAYQNLSDEVRAVLPDFKTLCAEIKAEVNAAFDAKKGDEPLFMCDQVADGKTRYHEPMDFFWHMYHNTEFLSERQRELEKRISNAAAPLPSELADERFCALKPFLISYAPAYSWHCTTTSCLCNVYRFRLTEETKQWLLQFETDYELDGLEDLAFYQGEKLLFSSCTHEGFHSDYSKEKEA